MAFNEHTLPGLTYGADGKPSIRLASRGLLRSPVIPSGEYDIINFAGNPLSFFVHPGVSCATLNLSGTRINSLLTIPACHTLHIINMSFIDMNHDGPEINANEVITDSSMPDIWAAYMSPVVKRVTMVDDLELSTRIYDFVKTYHDDRISCFIDILAGLEGGMFTT